MEGIWNEYSIFEESVISSRDHNADERKRIADRQKQLVDEDHKLAADVLAKVNSVEQFVQGAQRAVAVPDAGRPADAHTHEGGAKTGRLLEEGDRVPITEVK